YKTIELDLDLLKNDIDKKSEVDVNSNKQKNNYKLMDNIPVIDDPSERNYNEPYRKSDDDSNVIRLIQKAPKGTPKKVAEFVSVAGVQRNQDDAIKVISGDTFSFKLEKEPNNPYDKNAIKVIGIFEASGEEKSLFIGYVPKEVAKEIVMYEKLKPTL